MVDVVDFAGKVVALPTEGVDRNNAGGGTGCPRTVALPTEGVDRNSPLAHWIAAPLVALPTEGVDRNSPTCFCPSLSLVALPTEGVDRNRRRVPVQAMPPSSPSPRRAWIEIRCKFIRI